MSLVQIHAGLANSSVLFSLIISAYGFWQYFRKQGISGNFWGVLAVGELLYVAQGLAGVILFLTVPARPETWRWVHILYGIVAVITLPGTFAYTKGKDERREALVYGVVGLFLTGIVLRAITTA